MDKQKMLKPAYPRGGALQHLDGDVEMSDPQEGMTLLEYYAGLAMSHGTTPFCNEQDRIDWVKRSIHMAVMLIEEIQKYEEENGLSNSKTEG